MKKTLLAVMAMVSLSGYSQMAIEGFETWPASGWTIHNNGVGAGITWQQAGESPEQPPYGGEYAAFLDRENVPDGTLAKDWLVTPSFMPPANAVLTFASRLTLNEDQGSIYKIMLLPSGGNPDVLSDYVILQEWTEMQLNPVQKEYIIKNVAIPAAYTATSVRLAFYMENDNGDRWLVDDVHITSECYSPTNLSVTNITATSADLNWTQTGGATNWEIQVIPDSDAPTGTGVLYSGSLPYTVTNLVPGTSYKYYVRALCPDGGISNWVGPKYFLGNTCPVPTNVEVSGVTPGMITYTWTPAEGVTSYEYWFTGTNVLPNESTIPSGIVDQASVVLAGLDPSQNHKFYVRSVCGAGIHSPWAGLTESPEPIANVIHGSVLYDSNEDDICGEGDTPLPFAEVQVSVNGIDFSVYTNENGDYYLYNAFLEGTHTFSFQVVSSVFNTIEPVEVEITFAEGLTVEVNHCLGQPLAVNDLAVTFIPLGAARPGFNAEYKVVARNSGSILQEDVVLNLSFDNSRINYVSSDFEETSASGGTLSIPIGDIEPFSSVSGNVVFHVMIPPTNVGGETLSFEAELSEVENEVTPDDNTALLHQIIVNSYDPNDITVHEGAKIYEEQAGDYLTYTIRFQNTGTAEAINIKLENTLDDLLDWETFKPIASSHSYEVKRTGNLLEFEYKDIFLPDSTSNQVGSHGFVTYKIKPKAEYGLGDIVSNTAEIYFDFNEAIITNIATTEVVAMTAGLNNNAFAIARLYPNPVKDQLHVEVAQGELRLITIHDINGRLCLSADAETIDTNTLNSGIYFVKVTTDAGSANYKIIKH